MTTTRSLLAVIFLTGAPLCASEPPLAHWPLKDGSGQTVKESVASHKAFLGASPDADEQDPKWVNGRLVFDGKNDCVTVGDGDDFTLTDKGTLAGWVKLDKAFEQEGTIIIKPSNWYFVVDAQRHPQFIYYHTDIFSGMRTCSYVPGKTPLPSGEWIHLAATFGGRALTFYVNGQIDSSRLFEDEVLVYTPRPVRIGCEAKDGRPFKGAIAAVSVYDRPLDPREIVAHMKRTDPRSEDERGPGAVRVGGDAPPPDTSGIQW